MTVLVALVLAGLYTVLKPIHQKNEAIFNKRAVLSAVRNDVSDLSDDEVLTAFNSIEQLVLNNKGEVVPAEQVKAARNFSDKAGLAEDLDMSKERKFEDEERFFPLYIYTKEDGSKNYITNIRGNGLWDEIWGYIALKDDANTIAGVAFDHKAETPGLGAEIKDNPAFPSQFKGEKLFNKDGEYVSVRVAKGGSEPSDVHAVDGISGATITCDGVTDMLDEGMEDYLPYLKTLKAKQN